MATSKKDQFSRDEIALADLCKALGHPARILIMKMLAARQACICGEIVEKLPLSQSTVSQHLKALKSAGLIQGEISGPMICYCLSDAGLLAMQKLLTKFVADSMKSLKNQKKCC